MRSGHGFPQWLPHWTSRQFSSEASNVSLLERRATRHQRYRPHYPEAKNTSQPGIGTYTPGGSDRCIRTKGKPADKVLFLVQLAM